MQNCLGIELQSLCSFPMTVTIYIYICMCVCRFQLSSEQEAWSKSFIGIVYHYKKNREFDPYFGLVAKIDFNFYNQTLFYLYNNY